MRRAARAPLDYRAGTSRLSLAMATVAALRKSRAATRSCSRWKSSRSRCAGAALAPLSALQRPCARETLFFIANEVLTNASTFASSGRQKASPQMRPDQDERRIRLQVRFAPSLSFPFLHALSVRRSSCTLINGKPKLLKRCDWPQRAAQRSPCFPRCWPPCA